MTEVCAVEGCENAAGETRVRSVHPVAGELETRVCDDHAKMMFRGWDYSISVAAEERGEE